MDPAVEKAARLLNIFDYSIIRKVSISHDKGDKIWFQFLRRGYEEPIYFHGTGFEGTLGILKYGLLPGDRQEASGTDIKVAFCSKSLENVQGYVGPCKFTDEEEFRDNRVAIIIGCIPDGKLFNCNNRNYKIAESWEATCVWIRRWGDTNEATPKQLFNHYLFQWLDKDHSKDYLKEHSKDHSIEQKYHSKDQSTEILEASSSEKIICYYCSIYRDHPGGSNVIATHTKYIKKRGEKPVCEFCYNW